jgi:hypothetical protein
LEHDFKQEVGKVLEIGNEVWDIDETVSVICKYGWIL